MTTKPSDAALIACGDQVQQAVTESEGARVVAFILINTEGLVEYRTKLPTPVLIDALQKATDVLKRDADNNWSDSGPQA